MHIRIVVGHEHFAGSLDDSAASRDLIAQLPLDLTMSDHGSVEKTGPLPQKLSTKGKPDGADPNVGDIGYWSPAGNLVLYYGDQSYWNGIVLIGHFYGADRLAQMDGTIKAHVAPANG
jgi:hypothetical protein